MWIVKDAKNYLSSMSIIAGKIEGLTQAEDKNSNIDNIKFD